MIASRVHIIKLIAGLTVVIPSVACAVWYAVSFATPSPDRDYVLERPRTIDGTRRVVLLSRSYTLDQGYESMTGPRSLQSGIQLVTRTRNARPELLWITGVRSDVVDTDGRSSAPAEFFCHGNLAFSQPTFRDSDSRFTRVPDRRLVTLVPGLLDLSLPKGFGLPVYSNEALEYFTMALNLNEPATSRQVRFKTTISFVPDSDVPADDPVKPLFRRALYSHESADYEDSATAVHAGHTGHVAPAIANAVGAATRWPVPGTIDTSNTIHWLVSPGHFEGRVDVTRQLQVNEVTTAHFATAHLHPYADYVSLVDETRHEVVLTIASRDHDDRRGVAEMGVWTSGVGVSIHPNHRYGLLTVYENPTEKPVDAMSIVYLYLFDRRFAEGSR